jgi:hypothetical protein
MTQQRYRVLVDDNFHYMKEEERYEAGTFGSYAEALAKCKAIVEACLREMAKPGMTADELYRAYGTFGEDPWIPETPTGTARFSAWDYARTRSQELCPPGDSDTAT